jgi:dinuclear metal center YbgI/SA1388 family protein
MDALYPPATAESWDRVGLTVGSPAAAVGRISYAVDCTTEVVAEAVSVGADLIITHHPLLLRGVSAVTDDHPKGRIVGELITRGIALHTAHTNADKPVGGVAAALAAALQLSRTTPLVAAPTELGQVLVVYVPQESVSAVAETLAAAGAGAIGAYDRCSFQSPGEGTFRPLPGANPYLGRVGDLERVAETRIEMVVPPGRRGDVVRALLSAHPYETPAYHLIETVPTVATDSGLGRIGHLASPVTLAQLASRIRRALPSSGGGIRVSGDPDQVVEVVAVQAGAGDDLLDEARSRGADVYVTSDLRHHPASEARAWPDAPALVDIPHWAAEATWLPVVQKLVAERLAESGWEIPSVVSTVVTDPWSFAV